MILTGKALEDFNKWKSNNKNISTIEILDFRHLSKVVKNALIIEFFDSVGIYIILRRLTMCLEFKEWFFFIENNRGVHLNNYLEDECRVKTDSRQEATEKAIIKANEIYNERTNISN